MVMHRRRFEIRYRALLLLLIPLPAHAGIDDLPFALRLFLSVDRQSNYSSTLARQASIAALDGASANPGAAAYREPNAVSTTTTASFAYAPSSGGRQVIAAPVSLRWQSPDAGTITLAYAYTETRHAQGDDGLAQSLRSDEWIGSYGRRIGNNVSVGFTARLTSGKIVSDSYSTDLGGAPIRSATRFLAPDVNVGVATEITQSVSLGVAGGYTRARADTTITSLAPLLAPVAPGVSIVLPAGTQLDQADDIVSVYALRAGIGLRVDDATNLYVDAIGLHLSSHHSGAGDEGRIVLGAERRMGNGWALRGGIGSDSQGKITVSGGVGYRFGKDFDAELAVQTNAAPEINREIGRSRLVSASLGWRF